MRSRIKYFLIKTNLIFPVRKLREIFSKDIYKDVEKKGFMPDPEVVIIENTSLCNLKCKMCYINFTKYIQKGLSLEEWKRIIDKLPKSVKKINLIGGEPLLMKGAVDLIKYIDKKKIIPIICTNATLITEDIAKELSKTKAINHLEISIDGGRERHNKIRGVPTAFDKMIEGIKWISKYGGKIETVTTVIQDDNFDKLEEVVEVMHSLGIKHLLLEFERKYNSSIEKESKELLGLSSKEIISRDSSNLFHKFSEKDLCESLDRVEKLAKKKGIIIEYLPNNFKRDISLYLKRKFRSQKKKFICAYLPVARVDCQGNLITCFLLRIKMGNLLEKDFKTLWNSDKIKAYRKKLLRNNLVPVCDTCFQCREKNPIKALIDLR